MIRSFTWLLILLIGLSGLSACLASNALPSIGRTQLVQLNSLGSRVQEYTIPHAAYVTDIASGPDGDLWLTVGFATFNGIGEIAKISTTGSVTEYPNNCCIGCNFITPGPDGNMWFTCATSNPVPAAGAVFAITTSGQYLFPLGGGYASGREYDGIVSGLDGNIYFVDEAARCCGAPPQIDGIDLHHGSQRFVVAQLPQDASIQPVYLTQDEDNNLWFNNQAFEGCAEMLKTTLGGKVSSYCVRPGQPNSGPVAVGSDGNIWFTERSTSKIGRITRAGKIREFNIPSPALDITPGPDGALWFTEMEKIGRITTGGVVSEFNLPDDIQPKRLITGPDHNIWFTEQQHFFQISKKIGVLRLH